MTDTKEFPFTLRDVDTIAAQADAATDMFGWQREALVGFLPFEHARKWLKDDVTEEQWDEDRPRLEIESVYAEAVDYLQFAWGKAEGHRGISAGRSVIKMQAYCWLLGYDGTPIDDDGHYYPYGAPGLKLAAEFLRQPLPTDPDLVRMMNGQACSSDCWGGC